MNGTPVAATALVSVADINAGLLVFTPAANASGTGYASFTFQIQGDDATAIGDVSPDVSANTLTFNVTSVNDAPAGTDNTITINEDIGRVLTAADFGFTDPNDNPANLLAAVEIGRASCRDRVKMTGAAVAANGIVSVADINAGPLEVAPW